MLNEISHITNNFNVNILLHGSDTLDFDNNRLIFDSVHKFIENTNRLK